MGQHARERFVLTLQIRYLVCHWNLAVSQKRGKRRSFQSMTQSRNCSQAQDPISSLATLKDEWGRNPYWKPSASYSTPRT